MCVDQKMMRQQLKNAKKSKYEMGNFCEQFCLPLIAPSRRHRRNLISSLKNTFILKDELLSLKGLIKSLESINVLNLLSLLREDGLIVVKRNIMQISVQTHLIN